MRHKMGMTVLVGSLVLVGFASPLLNAQVSLADQLSAQYNLAKMGQDSSGYSIVQEGTLLVVQKGGILGSPYKNTTTRTATYKDGTVHSADVSGGTGAKIGKGLCGVLHKCPTTPDQVNDEMQSKLFKVGDKVYATKLAVDLAKDTVTMGIVACDTCNNTDPPTYNKVNLVFQFASGTLAKGNVSQVEDTIGQLLSISNDDQQQANNQGGNDQGNNGGNGAGNGGGNGAGGGQQQNSQPQQIEMGQSQDQVRNSLGQPDKMVNLGPKQIWVYKDLKVTFLNGRVVDVQ